MTTLGIGGNASEMAPIFDADGKERNDGIESRMDLDAIFEYMMKKYKAKTDEILNDGWDEENEKEQ